MFRSNPFTGCGFDQSPGVLVNFWWIVYLLISGGVLFYGLILNNLPDIYIYILYNCRVGVDQMCKLENRTYPTFVSIQQIQDCSRFYCSTMVCSSYL